MLKACLRHLSSLAQPLLWDVTVLLLKTTLNMHNCPPEFVVMLQLTNKTPQEANKYVNRRDTMIYVEKMLEIKRLSVIQLALSDLGGRT